MQGSHGHRLVTGWAAAFIAFSCLSVGVGAVWRPMKVGLVGLALALALVLLSTFTLRRTIEFLLVPVTGAYLIALLRAERLDARATLGGSLAPLLNLVASLFTSWAPAAVVLGAAVLASWRARSLPRLWVIWGSILPTVVAVLLLLWYQVS